MTQSASKVFLPNWASELVRSPDLEKDGSVEWWNGQKVPVVGGIFRFVSSDNYSSTFGFQWKRFAGDQIDSRSEVKISRERVISCTKWKLEELNGNKVLEAGCGAGRFTEVLAGSGAHLFSFDYSQAVEVARANNLRFEGVVFAQANIFEIPTPADWFDYVFCYGVIQHTPDPKKAFYSLVSQLKPGGKLSVDIYLKDGKIRPWKAKYLWRWLTVKIPAPILYYLVWIYVPLWLPFDTVIRRIPLVGNLLASVIPCFNWVNVKKPSWEGVRRTVLDTFDALSPAYDLPQTIPDVKEWCRDLGLQDIEVYEGANGLVANATKQ